MNKKKVISLSIMVFLIGGVLLTGHLTKDVSASTENPPFAQEMMLGRSGISDDDLAAALDVTVEELNNAQNEAFNSAVDAALEAGYITDSQAKTLKTEGMSFRALFRYLDQDQRKEFDQNTYLAEALGISESDLASAYQAVQQAILDEMVADGTITQEEADLQAAYAALQASDTFADNYKTALTEALNAEVKAGSLTQAQADLLLAQLDAMPASFGFGMHEMHSMDGYGMGGERGFGGRSERRGPGGF
ncbi:MAG: hypothetical protein AAGU15_00980 [Anaerolineaceae bacterium]